jgi:GNAT superfamily N-acetyltransferase
MLRYVVTAEMLRPPPAVDAEVRRLTAADLPAVQALYALWPETVFSVLMFTTGVYYGAYRAGELVAIAGTHAVSLRHGMGVIGNVFTHPDHRGAGLATATSGAVSRALIEAGAREVALNVHEENTPAGAAYRRAGFTLHEPFWEGRATINTETQSH